MKTGLCPSSRGGAGADRRVDEVGCRGEQHADLFMLFVVGSWDALPDDLPFSGAPADSGEGRNTIPRARGAYCSHKRVRLGR